MIKQMRFRTAIKVGKAAGSKDYNAIIELFEARLKADEEDLQALMMLAQYYEKSGHSDASMEHATKALAIVPTDFDMLMLVASYWHEQKDHDRTYHYVCRVLDSSPQRAPGMVKKLILSMLKMLSSFKKYRHVEQRAKEELANHEHNSKACLDWAEAYKTWYEERHAAESHTVH